MWNNLPLAEASIYTLHFINAAGCDSVATLNLTVNSSLLPPLITANAPTTFPTGGSVTLSSSQPNNNLWTTGVTTQSIVVTTSGIYKVAYTDPATSCSSLNSDSVVVTVTGGSRLAVTS